MEKRNDVVELSFELVSQIIEFSELSEKKKKYVNTKHHLKRETSSDANIREAQNASRQKNFIHKCIIALKEASEWEYRLMLFNKSVNYPQQGHLLYNTLSQIK
jgi:four helix bundle protein